MTRHDLGDLRVFNAAGVAVPYAVCRDQIKRRRITHRRLPLFAIRDHGASGPERTRIVIDGPASTDLHIVTPGQAVDGALSGVKPGAASDPASYFIEARAVAGRLRALVVDTAGETGAPINSPSPPAAIWPIGDR